MFYLERIVTNDEPFTDVGDHFFHHAWMKWQGIDFPDAFNLGISNQFDKSPISPAVMRRRILNHKNTVFLNFHYGMIIMKIFLEALVQKKRS